MDRLGKSPLLSPAREEGEPDPASGHGCPPQAAVWPGRVCSLLLRGQRSQEAAGPVMTLTTPPPPLPPPRPWLKLIYMHSVTQMHAGPSQAAINRGCGTMGSEFILERPSPGDQS